MSNETILQDPWRIEEQDYPWEGSDDARLRYLLQYALLAPSTRNTQPWRFKIEGRKIDLFADTSRWLEIADAHQRELHISLGCALENLLLAAEHFAFTPKVAYCPSSLNLTLAATIHLEPDGGPSAKRPADLFWMIAERATNHKVYTGEPVPQAVLEQLQRCGVEAGIHLHMTSDAGIRRKVDALVTRADALEFADSAFREEVARSLENFGTPWLFAMIAQLAVAYLDVGSRTARNDHELLMSSPVFGLLSTHADERKAWIKTGEVLERLCLTATAHGLCLQPVSQLVQVPEIRTELAALLPSASLLPQLPFRLGYAEGHAHHTPRRPLDEALC